MEFNVNDEEDYIEYPNPDKFVFISNIDDKGRIYFNGYPNIKTNAVVSFGGKNQEFSGKPKIFTRIGESDFGEELVFSFLIEGLNKEYDSNSDHKTIEFYLPKDKGIEFLEELLKNLKETIKNTEKEGKSI